ncbi:unnamed protein product [Rangifer tarandus platyrhynchus]|uniref:Uncharacterized protein n=1 Tax=Rangifer tarandus platyrhynchus TaxID=3082113 RepID=A0ABN8YNJ0_RANTA|nr:unnamed protein product [Rangifer tarandus platyrhynchus]
MKQQKANWNPRRDRDEGRKGGTGSPGGGRGREGCSRAEKLTLKEAEKGRERLGQRANGELNWRGGGTEGGDQSPPPGPSPRAPESAKHTEPRRSHAAPGTRAGAGGRAGPSGHHAPAPRVPAGFSAILGSLRRGRPPPPASGAEPPSPSPSESRWPLNWFLGWGSRGDGALGAGHPLSPHTCPREAEEAERFPGSAVSGPRCPTEPLPHPACVLSQRLWSCPFTFHLCVLSPNTWSVSSASAKVPAL